MFNAAIKIDDLEDEIKGHIIEHNKYKDYKKEYNNIEMPKHTLKWLQKSKWMLDWYTIDWIIKYLTLDSYEFVKNNAKTINNETGHEAIIYRDWALSRNEALKSALLQNKKTSTSFKDRIEWEIKDKV